MRANSRRPYKCRLLLIYRPQIDERLSWPSWLTYSGWVTHIVVIHQLRVERGPSKFIGHRPTFDPLSHATRAFSVAAGDRKSQPGLRKRIAVCATSTTPLRELTCHMGSHSVTCHPAEVTFPPLPRPIKAGTRFSDPRGMQGWVYLDLDFYVNYNIFLCLTNGCISTIEEMTAVKNECLRITYWCQVGCKIVTLIQSVYR